MDRPTVDVYEHRAGAWVEQRTAFDRPRAEAFGRRTTGRPSGPVADLGCGPGWYTSALGDPVIALDAARSMVERARAAAPASLPVQADLEALPFRSGALGAAFASRSYVHVPRSRLPLAFADLHRATAVGAPVELVVFEGDAEHGPFPDDDFPGRRFSRWPPDLLEHVVLGAGFDVELLEVGERRPGRSILVQARRARTLPDVVGPGMRMLVCGLNPSLYAADAGIGYARPGNRFWPAAVASGLASRDRDPRHLLLRHGVGMTDVVKRATVAAAELDEEEYGLGLRRVEALCAWLRPGVVCFVGLAGWRAAVDRRATAGEQRRRLGGVPVYLMPSTSGLNAHTRLDELAAHLRAAQALAGRPARR
jgi:double-stranded uracil-DNA glycosylase